MNVRFTFTLPPRVRLAALLICFSFLSPHFAATQTRDREVRVRQTATVGAWPTSAKRWALIIGVDQYTSGQIVSLDGASNDAAILAGALVRYAGFPKDQVILLDSNQDSQRQPTRSNILRFLSNLNGTVPKDGLLLVFFAGHGMERESRVYLLPSDAIPSNVILLQYTAVQLEQMKELILAADVGQVIFILDACRNDPIAARSSGDNLFTAAFSRTFDFELRNKGVKAFLTLFATDVGHRAYEYAEKRQGYFTWALVEGLKGEAANDKGEVTLMSLIKYVQDKVPKYVRRDLGSDRSQMPFYQMQGYKAEELVISAISPKKASFLESLSTSIPQLLYRVGYARGMSRHQRSDQQDATVTIQVEAKNFWTSSKLVVGRGDHIHIMATGRVILSTSTGQTSGPDGITFPDADTPMPKKPAGGLIAVIGADDNAFIFVGSSAEIVAERDGILFLSVNDGSIRDNDGSYRAFVELRRAPSK
jgi:uncharacterized caspase-like protein